jgi:ATP-binding cassette subfamily C (CFTR/MRP) protein 4
MSGPVPLPVQVHDQVHPADSPRTNPLVNILLAFVSPLLKKGEGIGTEDLWPLRRSDGAELLTSALRTEWEKELARASASGSDPAHKPQPSFARAWARAFLPAFAPTGLATWLKAMFALAQSRLILLLLGVIADPSASVGVGVGYALAAGLLGVCASLADAWYWRQTWFFGRRWQVATLGLLFEKATRLRVDALSEVSTGHVISLASNDVERFLALVHHIPHLVLTPIDFAIYAAVLYHDLGPACFAGLLLMLVVSVGQMASYSRAFGKLRRARAATTDERLNLTSQVISGIRVIKANSWEPPFLRSAREVRAKEVEQLKSQYRVRGAFEGLIHSKYLALTGAVVLTLWLVGDQLTPQKVYSATSLLYLLEMDRVWRMVENAENLTDANVSFRRFTRFLLLPEAKEARETGSGNGPAESGGGGSSVQGAGSDDPRAAAADDVSVSFAGSVPDGAGAGASTSASSVLRLPVDASEFAVDAESVTATVGIGEEAVATAAEGKSNDEPARSPRVVISNASMRVRRGELCAVIGQVGAGKSCLLLSLLGELPIASGSLKVAGKVSYAPQQPFVLSGTVRENITFGAPPDEAKLARTLSMCQLDREITPDTVVGEKGVTLSGGQRARLGLARCLYRQADIYLLDDPLSALDAEVGRKIFEVCVRGLVETGATVVLVTHQLRFLRAANTICVMQKGTVISQGSYAELREEAAGARAAAELSDPTVGPASTAAHPPLGNALAELLEEWAEEEREEAEQQERAAQEAAAAGGVSTPTGGAVPKTAGPGTPLSPSSASASASPAPATRLPDVTPSAVIAGDNGIAFREDGGHGAVSWATFKAYGKFWTDSAEGVLDTAHVVFVLVAAAIAFPLVGGWLGRWASMPLAEQQKPENLVYYLLILFAAVLLSVWRPIAFASRTVLAGKAIHNLAFRSVLTAPTAFFDARPAGSVLARFSKDVQVLDERLPLVFCDVVLQLGRAAGVLVLVCVSNPWVLLAIPVLLFAFVRIRNYFVRASRAIKRLEAASRPPILSVFAESLNGLPVIRAFNSVSRMQHLFFSKLDANSRPWTTFYFITRWLALRLDSLCVGFMTLSAMVAVLARDSISPGAAAMSLSFITMLLGELDWMVRQSVELENAMLSVERLLTYTAIETEDVETEDTDGPVHAPAQGHEEGARPDAEGDTASLASSAAVVPISSGSSSHAPLAGPTLGWPRSGRIEMNDVWMRYRRDGESLKSNADSGASSSTTTASPNPSPSVIFALRGVTVTIPAGHKLGVVGRTGAGKSSLLSALLRLSEPERKADGTTGVAIDGVDSASLPLTRLRRACSVIGQDPVLYAGTVRSNLDPFTHCTDDECRAALDAVCMLGPLEKSGGLSAPVAESGSNLSVGQRQLLCLARAVLRKSKILYIDEATANVDADTDAAIQRAIRTAFASATVISVAHRLSTVMDCDSILVLSAGRVAQHGPPAVLAADESGPFAILLREAAAKAPKGVGPASAVSPGAGISTQPLSIARGGVNGLGGKEGEKGQGGGNQTAVIPI